MLYKLQLFYIGFNVPMLDVYLCLLREQYRVRK